DHAIAFDPADRLYLGAVQAKPADSAAHRWPDHDASDPCVAADRERRIHRLSLVPSGTGSRGVAFLYKISRRPVSIQLSPVRNALVPIRISNGRNSGRSYSPQAFACRIARSLGRPGLSGVPRRPRPLLADRISGPFPRRPETRSRSYAARSLRRSPPEWTAHNGPAS